MRLGAAIMSVCLYTFCLTVTGPVSAVSGGDRVDIRDAAWEIRLDRLWGFDEGKKVGRDLQVRLNLVEGKVVGGVAFADRFNRSAHRVHDSQVSIDHNDKTFTARLQITMNPDRWVPKDGSVSEVTAELKGKLSRGEQGAWKIDGTYKATHEQTKASGKISGRIAPRQEQPQAVLAGQLFPVKIDDLDFPYMEVQIATSGGQVDSARIGMSWNRWAHRWVELEAGQFEWDPRRQRITAEIPIPARAVDIASAPDAKYLLKFDGSVISGLFVVQVVAEPVDSPSLPRRVFNGGGPTWEYGGGRDLKSEDYRWMYKIDTRPWFVESEGFGAPAAGEHPRLLFRKDEIQRIRARAKTETGRQIVQRLRTLLGNDGKKIPENMNKVKPGNVNRSDLSRPAGTVFTSFHAPGYAMLYQLTGEQLYADLARKSVEMMFDGAIDRDNRYAWQRPGTMMRAGSLLASVALAYDLAYDGWDAEFRRKVAAELQNYSKQLAETENRIDIQTLAGRTGYPPASNHYGSFIGGLTAMLAILGDPGVDNELVRRRIADFEQMIPNYFYYGQGEGGWYQEGPHPSRLSVNGGLTEALQALRNVTGRDYISARPHPQFSTLRWVMWLTRDGGGHPLLLNRGTYGDDRMYSRAPMLSHSGDFAFGFGAVEPKYVPAVLWTYENFVETWERNGRPEWMGGQGPSFNAFVYPHHAVHAMVNWPIGVEPVNPGQVLPKHVADTVNDFYVSRNRWKDADDIVVTFSTGGGPWGYHRGQGRGKVMVRAYGRKLNLVSRFGHYKPTGYEVAEDGSFSMGMRPFFYGPDEGALAVDLSGKSGADLVVIVSSQNDRLAEEFEKNAQRDAKDRQKGREPYGGLAVQEKLLKQDGRVTIVSTIDREKKPQIEWKDGQIRVGSQVYRYQNQRFVFDPLD